MVDIDNTVAVNTRRKQPVLSRRALIIILIVIAQIGLIFSVFGVGYKIGQDVGRKDATLAAGISGFNSLLGSVSNPFRSTTGKVTEISNDSITVETSGETRTAKITDKTKITRRSEQKQVSDIEVGVRVSVFFGESSDQEASRIIINE